MIATDADWLVYVPIDVTEWRRQELRRAGCSPALAHFLAVSAADLHVMLAAKAAGCSDRLMGKIFEGEE